MLHRTVLSVLAAIVLVPCIRNAAAQQVRVDFGSALNTTRSSYGQNWVNLTSPTSDVRVPLVNYSTGAVLPWTIGISNDFGGTTATTGALSGAAATLFPASAANDGFRTVSGNTAGQFTLRNLDPNLTYKFDVFASNFALPGVNMSGLYTAVGANSVSGTLNAANNRSSILSLGGIRPDENRQIKLRLDDAPANNNLLHISYINDLSITASPATLTPPPVETAKNLLFFGNSFTFLNDMPASLAEIAVADRHARPYIVTEVGDSRSLSDQVAAINQTPANNVGKLPAGQKWSNVIMQEFSTGATKKFGDPVQFKADTKTIYNAVKAGSPGVKPTLYETWSYLASDPTLYGPAASQYPNPAAMQADIRASYAAAASELNALYPGANASVAGVGDYFEKLSFAADLYGGYDTKHPGPRGSLIAALALYKNVYGENVSDIPWSAVSSYYSVRSITQADWLQMTSLVDGVPMAFAASLQIVPEPASLGVLGMLALAARRRR